MKKLSFALLGIVLFMASCTPEEETIVNNVVTNEITVPTTWTADQVWVIDGNIYVSSDLVIQPGTIIKFNPGASLSVGYGVYGSLMAVGTLDKPIIFTSNANIPSAGDYYGINFYGSSANSSSLAFCNIEYAGYSNGNPGAALYLDNATISLVSCTIQKSAGAGILSYFGDFKLFSLNTIKDCADYPVDIPASCAHKLDALSLISGKGIYINDGGLFGQAVTWSKLTVPYILYNLDIYDDGTLTIAPGTKLHFLSGGYVSVGYGSFGKLVANGTLLEPIEFSSSASSPSPGDWRGLEFFESTSGGSSIDFCIISYGGASDSYQANIYSEYNGSKLSITNSTVSYSSNCGIRLYDCTPDISGIVYVGNADNLCN